MCQHTVSHFLLFLLLPVLLQPVIGDEPDVAWKTSEGLSNPESTYYHAESDQIFVSNMDGDSSEKDGTGWISRLQPDGTMIEQKWVDGLNAPKGIRCTDELLWVSDIDRLLAFRLSDGERVHTLSFPNAKFLNDVATAPDGTVYVSDMRTNTIYRVKGEEKTVFVEGEQLESPNGILVSGTRLLVGGWSSGSEQPGHLYSIDLRTKEKTRITPEPVGNLDGLELDGRGNYLVSDWTAGELFSIDPDGTPTSLLQLEKGTADIGYSSNHNLLLIPNSSTGNVSAYQLNRGPDQFTKLLDAELSKWQTEGNWTLREDGTLELSPGENDRGWKRFEDYLTSKERYGNFELHVEYKIKKGGNTGIFVRIDNPAKPVTTGIEVQVLDVYHKTGELSHHDHGGIIETSPPSKNMSRPAGYWNHMVVICNDQRMRVILNGEQVQDLQLDQSDMSDRPPEGHISIQDHGQPLEVRNVRIHRLED